MTNEKECQCGAVKLLSRMSNVYSRWLDNLPGVEKSFESIMEDLYAHLEKQLELPTNTTVKEQMKDRLDIIDKRVNDARVGIGTATIAVDTIRNEIHLQRRIREAFLCGPPGEESGLSKKVSEGMEILANSTGENPGTDAKEKFDRIYEELSCGG